jgi:adenosine kinase
MQQHARECAELGVPFMFDPGQGLPMFSAEEIDEFLRHAAYVALNDYEGKMLEEKTGRKLEEHARRVKALVVTQGAQGSLIYAGGKRHEIPCAPADKVVDPTGCGDAYRAGLLYGLAHGWDWSNTGKLASVMGAIKISHRGAQNHTTGRDEIEARFKRAFGHSPPGA